MSDVPPNKDDLIGELANDLSPCRVIPHPLHCMVVWLFAVFAYGGFAISLLGARPDILERLQDPIYLFELILLLLLSMSAALCSLYLRVPDMRGKQWLCAVPITLFSLFIIGGVLQAILQSYDMPHVHWHSCLNDAVLFVIVPAPVLIFLARYGSTTAPYLMSFMNALAVGAIGYLCLRITCMSDDVAHLGVFHLLPYVVLAVVLVPMGRYIYRW